MPQIYRKSNQPFTAKQQASMYYARKRQRQRAEATVDGGGMRAVREEVGLIIVVTVTTS